MSRRRFVCALFAPAIGLTFLGCDRNDVTSEPSAEVNRIVTILQSDGWPNTESAVALVEQFAAKVSVPVEITRITVKTDDDAQRLRFIGSPTVRINGLDVDPSARDLTQYGFTWRMLTWTQDATETERILRDAFEEAEWLKLSE